MTDKNLLLGFGERLTSHSEIKRGGGNKKLPYNIHNAREALAQPLSTILDCLAATDERAKPRGEGVFMMTLHPAFLSRSYFPAGLLQACGLRDIGSKQVNIIPRNVTNPRQSGKALATASLFVAGGRKEISQLQHFLVHDGTGKGLVEDLIEIEDLSWINANSRIRGEIEDEKEYKFEVVLHARSEDDDIVSRFQHYATEMDMQADLARRVQVGGLLFLPVVGTGASLKQLAEFTFLRVARVMPDVRIALPSVARTSIAMPPLSLPNSDAIIDGQRAAIFDGGIGTLDLNKWVTEYTYPETNAAHAPLLMHGSEVTSTFLFGRVKNGQTTLPTPYMAVDHFRVLSGTNSSDPDLFDILHRIRNTLDSGNYKLANLSLGPRMPIWDDEVHPWTSVLDQLCARHGILVTVAVGNDGDVDGANRIQPPSDMVNAIAVGAADSAGQTWQRASYSCIGPGRSPGFVKPDGVAFGGSEKEGLLAYNPYAGVVSVCGTSYSSPLVLRTAAGLLAHTDYPLSSLALKALLVHTAETRKISREEIGWGRFSEDALSLLQCAPDAVTVVYQGTLAKGEFLRVPVPFPSAVIQGKVEIKATLSILTPTDPEHAVNYTRAGMEVRFRPKHGINDPATKAFFSGSTQYQTEQECREDGHKWETCLHHEQRYQADTLSDPVFDIEYHARKNSRNISVDSRPDIQYGMIITVRVEGMTDLYNLIRQRHSVLAPVEVRAEVQVDNT